MNEITPGVSQALVYSIARASGLTDPEALTVATEFTFKGPDGNLMDAAREAVRGYIVERNRRTFEEDRRTFEEARTAVRVAPGETIRTWLCQYCPARFSSPSEASTHRRVVHGE
jgi:hypothetical protein